MTAKPTDLLPKRIWAFTSECDRDFGTYTDHLWSYQKHDDEISVEYVRSDVADKWKSEALKLRDALVRVQEDYPQQPVEGNFYEVLAEFQISIATEALQSFDSSTKGDT